MFKVRPGQGALRGVPGRDGLHALPGAAPPWPRRASPTSTSRPSTSCTRRPPRRGWTRVAALGRALERTPARARDRGLAAACGRGALEPGPGRPPARATAGAGQPRSSSRSACGSSRMPCSWAACSTSATSTSCGIPRSRPSCGRSPPARGPSGTRARPSASPCSRTRARMILYPLTWLNLLMRPWVYYTALRRPPLRSRPPWACARWARHLGLAPQASVRPPPSGLLSGPYPLPRRPLAPLRGGVLDALGGPGRRLRALSRRAAGAWPSSASPWGLQILAGSADMCAMTLLVAATLGAARVLDLRRPFSASEPRGAGPRHRRRPPRPGPERGLLGHGPRGRVARRAGRPAPERAHLLVPAPRGAARDPAAAPLRHLAAPARTLRAALFEGREPFFAFLYLGIASLPLLGAALATPHPLRRVLVGLLIVAGLVALGTHTPVMVSSRLSCPRCASSAIRSR